MQSKFKFKTMLSPLFVLLACFILYFGNLYQFIMYALAVLIHEAAHYIVAKRLGYKLSKFYIMPYGVCLNYKDNIISNNDEVLIAIAGPLVNFLLCFILVALWWIFPETYYYLDYFCFSNLILGLFNFIPCYPLDGGRVLIATLSKKYDREKVFKIAIIFNYIISFMLCLYFIFSVFKGINYSYLLLAIFLFGGTINPNKFSSYNFLSLGLDRKRLLKNGANIKFFAVSYEMPIYKILSKFSKYKYNIVYIILSNGTVKVMSESNINAIAVKYSPVFSIGEILGK